MERVLVAGASGSLGRHMLDVLKERGYRTRALCRSIAKGSALPADEVVLADAMDPSTLANCMDSVDIAFSCLGQTVNDDLSIRRPGYMNVDLPANLNLLETAKTAGVPRFVYVSVLNAAKFPSVAYLAAHAQVANAVKASGLSYGIVEPTGFYSAFKAVHNMIANNRAVSFGKGASKSNPIHERDLAEACAGIVAESASATHPVGGPEIYTRREVFEAAFAAQGKRVRLLTVPAWMPGLMSGPVGLLAPRIGDLMGFLEILSSNDFIAPRYGTRLLPDYLEQLAQNL